MATQSRLKIGIKPYFSKNFIQKLDNRNPAINYFFCTVVKSPVKPKLINIAKNKQTTGLGHITVKDLKELKVVNPGSKLIKTFDLIASPILERIQHSLEDNVYLSRIRNGLLSRLISGSIRLKDI